MVHTNSLTLMLIIYEVQLCIVNKNLFGSNNIVLQNMCHHVIFSLPDFPANITILGLILLMEVSLNSSLFCFVMHTTLWSAP